MKHVPIAEFKDRLSEYVAAVQAGEEITITRHGRTVARLIAPDEPHENVVARRREAMVGLARIRADLQAKGVHVSRDDMREWVNEGRP